MKFAFDFFVHFSLWHPYFKTTNVISNTPSPSGHGNITELKPIFSAYLAFTSSVLHKH
jgi:hypothetical protein